MTLSVSPIFICIMVTVSTTTAGMIKTTFLGNSKFFQRVSYRMKVNNYTVTDGSVLAWVEIVDEFYVIEDLQYMRAKRLKCTQRMKKNTRFPIT